MNAPKPSKELRNRVKRAIREKYAWPGGYPMFLVTRDGAALCVKCGRSEFRQIAWDWFNGQSTGWFAESVDINWEDTELTCDHCGEKIESAYGDA